MNAIIVENEKFSANVLRTMLEDYCPGVNLMEDITSATDAIERIPALDPDLIFFDIDLGDGNAFDVLKKLDADAPPVIFTTAFDHFAVRAFKLSAIDYLLKPISIKELQLAVEKAKNSSLMQQYKERFENFMGNRSSNTRNQIALPALSGYYFVEITSIVRFEAEGSYTRVFFRDKEEILLSYNLKHFEDLLKDDCFFRAHYSHLINLNMISRYIKGAGGYLIMKDGSKVDVASRRKEVLLQMLGIH
jgi:two-component system LytT family response regulator